MSPFAHFLDVWNRCAHLSLIHAYVATNTTSILQPDEILRAEWVARVSALDLYVHELVAQRMLETFRGVRQPTPKYLEFKVSNEIMGRIRSAQSTHEAEAAFDFEVRRQLGIMTFQEPEKIADGIRLVSRAELWNEIALNQGASEQTKQVEAKRLKSTLSAIVIRRNKIAHEGDLQPTVPRVPWQISISDTQTVKKYIADLVDSIEAVA